MTRSPSGYFIADATFNSPKIYASANGTSGWTLHSTFVSTTQLPTHLIYARGRFFATSQNSLFTSADGVSWGASISGGAGGARDTTRIIDDPNFMVVMSATRYAFTTSASGTQSWTGLTAADPSIEYRTVNSPTLTYGGRHYFTTNSTAEDGGVYELIWGGTSVRVRKVANLLNTVCYGVGALPSNTLLVPNEVDHLGLSDIMVLEGDGTDSQEWADIIGGEYRHAAVYTYGPATKEDV
jgi:hypothetical protein